MSVEVYASGSTGSLQAKTITPTKENQTIKADVAEGYEGLSSLTLVGAPDLIPSNVRDGVSIFGVTGTMAVCYQKQQYLQSTYDHADGNTQFSKITIPLVLDDVDYTAILNNANRIYLQALFTSTGRNILVAYIEKNGSNWEMKYTECSTPTNTYPSYGITTSVSDGELHIVFPSQWVSGGTTYGWFFDGQYAIYIG